MSVFLVQHGLSLPKEQDPERGLSEAGRRRYGNARSQPHG